MLRNNYSTLKNIYSGSKETFEPSNKLYKVSVNGSEMTLMDIVEDMFKKHEAVVPIQEKIAKLKLEVGGA